MLTVGDRFPEFELTSVVSLEKGQEFEPVSNESYAGQWKVVFFWPMDFTFVCPTEIAEFGAPQRGLRGPRRAGARRSRPTRSSSTSPGARTTRTCATSPSPCWPTPSAS